MSTFDADLPRVVLLGRTNVGKSTFFSRLTGEQALASQTPHTTRDAKHARVEWRGKTFLLVDTGGFDIDRTEPLHADVTGRIAQELAHADLVLCVTDNRHALTDNEKSWIKKFIQKKIPVAVIANKSDKPYMRRGASKIHYKGVRSFAVSSVNGGGTGDVLDYIVESTGEKTDALESVTFRVGLIGRTNVGKSSLINALARHEYAIVSDTDHTTREPQHVIITHKRIQIDVMDTAGAQKRPKQQIHRESKILTEKAINECDVIALVTEAGKFPIPSQDIELAHHALENHKSLFIIINKWDTAQDQTSRGEREEQKRIRRALPSLLYVPIVMASAKTRMGIPRILDTAHLVWLERFVELPKSQIRTIQQRLSQHVWSVTQLELDPPRFHAIATSKSVPRAVNDIFEKVIRETHPFIGTPLILSIAKRNARHARTDRSGKSG